jgi:hypothetical protein
MIEVGLRPAAKWSIPEWIRHSPGFGIAAQVVRGEFADASLRGELLDYVPHKLFGDLFAPRPSGAAHTSENLPGFDACGLCARGRLTNTLHLELPCIACAMTVVAARVSPLKDGRVAVAKSPPPASAQRVRLPECGRSERMVGHSEKAGRLRRLGTTSRLVTGNPLGRTTPIVSK